LILAVSEANPRTIVVLNSGAAVLMNNWIDQIPALLEAWFPGQEGGNALADVLFGDTNPSGKLPTTFPKRWEDAPAYGNYPGEDGAVHYAEGIFVGYRHFDKGNIEPLFPFGHGLSYTTFAYDDLRVRLAGDGFDVTFRVRNSGRVAGDEVAQVYLGPPGETDVPMVPKQLVGFERIALQPGERREVTIRIDDRRLSYWSAESAGWVRTAGERTVFVGASSRDIRLEGTIEVAGR